MRVIILGSAAGGGLPQWNCGCSNCQEARLSGTGRTQSSVALSADGARWVLLNASPDLRAQVASRPELWPRGARGTAISAVVCTDGEIDHTLGLLLLREAATRFPLYASARSEEHTSELQSRLHLVCRLLLEKKNNLCAHVLSVLKPYSLRMAGRLPSKVSHQVMCLMPHSRSSVRPSTLYVYAVAPRLCWRL